VTRLLRKPESLISLANRKVSFTLAASWAGVEVWGAGDRGTKVHCPFGLNHPDGGMEPAMRVYRDHGYCFAETRYFSTVSLLAEVWQLSWDDAAVQALDKIGYKPVSHAHLWAEACREPAPDLEALTRALTVFCEGIDPEWKKTQYEVNVASVLGRCLGLLPLVKTRADWEQWLDSCKIVMRKCIEGR
jgi:hypothetical protein